MERHLVRDGGATCANLISLLYFVRVQKTAILQTFQWLFCTLSWETTWKR